MINSIYILLAIEILFWCLSYKISRGNMLSPTLITFTMFIIATSCIVINIDFWNVDYSYNAIGIMLLGFSTMEIAEYCAIHIKGNNYNYKPKKLKILTIAPLLNNIIIILSVFFLIAYIYEVYIKGVSAGVVGLDAIGVAKYDETYGLSLISKIGFRFIQITFLSYSYIVMYNKMIYNKYNLYELLPLFFFLLMTIVSGNRMAFMKFFIILYVYWIAYSYNKRIGLITVIKKILPYSIFISVSFYLLRTITKINSTTGERSFNDYITYYIGSPIYLFSKALELPQNNNSYFGELTFSGIYDSLGININSINPYILVGGDSNFAGNVFSWFYRPYADFGLLGMLIFTFINYFLFSFLLYKKIIPQKGEKYNFALLLYADFFFVIVMSFYYCQTCWAYTFNNIIAYVLAVIMIIAITKYNIVYK